MRLGPVLDLEDGNVRDGAETVIVEMPIETFAGLEVGLGVEDRSSFCFDLFAGTEKCERGSLSFIMDGTLLGAMHVYFHVLE